MTVRLSIKALSVFKNVTSKSDKESPKIEHKCNCCQKMWSGALKVKDDFKIDCHMDANFNVLRVCTTSLKRMYN